MTAVSDDAESVLAAATAMAEQIAANSPLAVPGSKAVLDASRRRQVQEDLDNVALWNAAFLYSDDLRAAITAFIKKQSPEYKGQ